MIVAIEQMLGDQRSTVGTDPPESGLIVALIARSQ